MAAAATELLAAPIAGALWQHRRLSPIKAAIRALDLANRNRPFVQDSAFRRLSKWRSDGFPRDSRSSEYEYGPEPCLADPLERERVGDRRGARIDRAERWRWVAPVGINSSPTELC